MPSFKNKLDSSAKSSNTDGVRGYISVWSNDDPNKSQVGSGFITLTPELLEQVNAAVDPETGRVELRLIFWNNNRKEVGDNKPDFTGSVELKQAR